MKERTLYNKPDDIFKQQEEKMDMSLLFNIWTSSAQNYFSLLLDIITFPENAQCDYWKKQ